jgi:hypothetical protein
MQSHVDDNGIRRFFQRDELARKHVRLHEVSRPMRKRMSSAEPFR